MDAYGFSTKMSEADCVAELIKTYQKLTEEKQKIVINPKGINRKKLVPFVLLIIKNGLYEPVRKNE